MTESNHPADGRFRNRAIHRAGRNRDQHIGGGAGFHIHRIITHAESRDDQELLGLRNTFGGHRGSEHNHSLCVFELVRTDLFSMFLENVVFYFGVIGKHGQADILILRLAVAVVKIRRERDCEGVHLNAYPLSMDCLRPLRTIHPRPLVPAPARRTPRSWPWVPSFR